MESVVEHRDWDPETIFHLWFRLSYILGLHFLVGVGVSLQGNRFIVTETECDPKGQSRMEAVLDDLCSRGLGSGMLLTIPGDVVLHPSLGHSVCRRVVLPLCRTGCQVPRNMAESKFRF